MIAHSLGALVAQMALGAVLTLAAERDRLISVDTVERTAQYHRAPCITMPGAGHAMMLDTPWLDSARAIAHWLTEPRAGRDAA